MIISQEQKDNLEQIYQTFLHDEKIKRMQEIPMHRGSNCYVHCFKVAKRAVERALKSHRKNIDLEVVLIGAILHDYYLYDWRSDRSKKKRHGYNHQIIASQNASRDFNVSDGVKKVIESHMWPLRIKNYPKSIEAKIVSLSDKGVAMREALTSKKHKQRIREQETMFISKLF